MRIVSLLPSATEIICDLGLIDQLVGVTHECDYPAGVCDLPKVTHTLIPTDATSAEIDGQVREQLATEKALYTLNMPVLERLRPDLIVTQALCDVCAVAESEVSRAACNLPGKPQVVNLEPTTLSQVFESMRTVGEAADAVAQADAAIQLFEKRVAVVTERAKHIAKPPRVVLLEWIDPPFSSGHWSPELVRLAGGKEMIGKEGEPSRQVEWDEIVAADPEVMLIACCGFNKERTRQDLPILKDYSGFDSLTCVRNGKVYITDGNAYFSRPGPRLMDSLEMLSSIFDVTSQFSDAPNLHLCEAL